MAILTWPQKDPDEVLDYVLDWTDAIAEDDQIITSTWIVPPGITKDSDTHTATHTTIWLSGGTISDDYLVLTNRVVTEDGRTMDQSVRLKIAGK